MEKLDYAAAEAIRADSMLAIGAKTQAGNAPAATGRQLVMPVVTPEVLATFPKEIDCVMMTHQLAKGKDATPANAYRCTIPVAVLLLAAHRGGRTLVANAIAGSTDGWEADEDTLVAQFNRMESGDILTTSGGGEGGGLLSVSAAEVEALDNTVLALLPTKMADWLSRELVEVSFQPKRGKSWGEEQLEEMSPKVFIANIIAKRLKPTDKNVRRLAVLEAIGTTISRMEGYQKLVADIKVARQVAAKLQAAGTGDVSVSDDDLAALE